MNHKRRREKVLQKCRAMREAKERKRLASADPVTCAEAQRITLTGRLWGDHTIRILARSDTPHIVHIEVDGAVTCAKTVRGARSLIARKLASPLLPINS